jgi:hypothetical protein
MWEHVVMTNGAGDTGNEGQESWSEYEDAIERREALYRSGSTIFWDLTVLVELWLEELHDIGLSALDPVSQAPPKQGEVRGPEHSSPWSDARPVHVGKGKALWLRFDGDRTEQGYRSISVSDEPLRTDSAIVAALAALEATAVDKEVLNLEIKRLGALLHAHSDTPLGGPLTERVTEVALQLRENKTRDRDLQFLQEDLHLRFFEFVLALLRDRRPGFDELSLEEQLGTLRMASSYVSALAANSLKLIKFLEYGTPKGLPTRTLETADKRVEAAVLRDVAGLSPEKIAERFGIPKPPDFSIKKDYPEVRDLVKKGRSLLEEALGKNGWRERKEAMRAEMKWWQSLSKEKQWAEHLAGDLERLIGPNPFGDLARRQVLGDDDPNKRKNRIRHNPFAR